MFSLETFHKMDIFSRYHKKKWPEGKNGDLMQSGQKDTAARRRA